MDDLGQIIFIVLFILFGLISSWKKKGAPKPGTQQPGGTTRPPYGGRSRTPGEAVAPAEADLPVRVGDRENADGTARPKRALAEELLDLLQARTEPEREPYVMLPEYDDEAQSLETLEPAGGESHVKFRERYVLSAQEDSPYVVQRAKAKAGRPYAIRDTSVERPYAGDEPAIPQPYAIYDPSKRKKYLSRSELRHAFVMKEVLGPPKALQEQAGSPPGENRLP